jgi:hypothetical protein
MPSRVLAMRLIHPTLPVSASTPRRRAPAALALAACLAMMGCAEGVHEDPRPETAQGTPFVEKSGVMPGHSNPGCDLTSARSGKWSQPATWDAGRPPSQGERVCVGHDVKYDLGPADAVSYRSVTVTGKLKFKTGRSTRLRVQDLLVMTGGLLRIGTAQRPLPVEHTAEIVFEHHMTSGPRSEQFPHQLGLIAMGGRIELHGHPIRRIARLPVDLRMGQSSLSGPDARRAFDALAAHNWKTGDEVLLPATTFEREIQLGNETRRLNSLMPNSVGFDQELQHDHLRVLGRPLFAANLSANIVLRSAEPGVLERRGHVMVMKGPDGRCGETNISGVRFDELGRTDKTRPTARDNQKKMYTLHFHECGSNSGQRSHVVRDSVAVGSPGWAFVNHASDVVYDGNVAYDFAGAGFVSEAGDERGEFSNNLAAGGRGVGTYRFRRLYINDRDRARQADLAFHGDGFWLASPFVSVTGNAAVGNHGSGLVWYQVAVDSRQADAANADEVGLSLTVSPAFLLPAEAEALGYGTPKRRWAARPNEFLVADLPIFGEVSGNYAAANFVGARLRYARSLNSVFLLKLWDIESVNPYLADGAKPPQASIYPRESSVRDMVLQNNEIGLHTSYSARVRFTGLRVEADDQLRPRFAKQSPQYEDTAPTGIEMNHPSNWSHALEDVVVRGYAVGERLMSTGNAVTQRADVEYRECDQNTLTWSQADVRGRRR